MSLKTSIGRWKRRCFKAFLKRLSRDQRPLRMVMRGRRLKIKQHQWLHFNKHPWEK